MCLTPTLPGNLPLRRRMKRQGVHIFHTLGIPLRARQENPSSILPLPFPPRLSPLSVSCIITSRFKDEGRRGGKSEGGLRGWEGWGHMFVSITARPQRGDRVEEYFLASRRKRAVSQEGSDIVNPPPLFPYASFSHSPGLF